LRRCASCGDRSSMPLEAPLVDRSAASSANLMPLLETCPRPRPPRRGDFFRSSIAFRPATMAGRSHSRSAFPSSSGSRATLMAIRRATTAIAALIEHRHDSFPVRPKLCPNSLAPFDGPQFPGQKSIASGDHALTAIDPRSRLGGAARCWRPSDGIFRLSSRSGRGVPAAR
jgi:hypothetical protein